MSSPPARMLDRTAWRGRTPPSARPSKRSPVSAAKTANVVLNTAFGSADHRRLHAYLPPWQPDRTGPGQDGWTKSEQQTAPCHAHGIQERCPPLADPARPLCVQGAQSGMCPLHRRRSLFLQGQDAVKAATCLVTGVRPAPELAEEAVTRPSTRPGWTGPARSCSSSATTSPDSPQPAVDSAARAASCLSVAGCTANGLFTEGGWQLDRRSGPLPRWSSRHRTTEPVPEAPLLSCSRRIRACPSTGRRTKRVPVFSILTAQPGCMAG